MNENAYNRNTNCSQEVQITEGFENTRAEILSRECSCRSRLLQMSYL